MMEEALRFVDGLLLLGSLVKIDNGLFRLS